MSTDGPFQLLYIDIDCKETSNLHGQILCALTNHISKELCIHIDCMEILYLHGHVSVDYPSELLYINIGGKQTLLLHSINSINSMDR